MSQPPPDYNKAFEQIANSFAVTRKKERDYFEIGGWIVGIVLTVALFSVMYGIGIFILVLAAHLQFDTPFPNFLFTTLAGFGFALTSTLSRAMSMWSKT